jgi:3-dehydroquinate dehydratase-2
MQIAIVNGPNLNLLGRREIDIYGNQDFQSFFETLKGAFSSHHLSYFQSNHEGELIDYLQEIGDKIDGIVLNPAGYSHSSVALADTIAAITAPVVEVHISNIFKREEFRHKSFISSVAVGTIAGLGLKGYQLAVEFLTAK